MKWCLNSKSKNGSRKRFNIILQALNIYTLFTNLEETKSQLDKFIKGVQCESPLGLPENFIETYKRYVSRLIPRAQVKRGGNSLLEYRGSDQKWAPQFHSEKRVRQSKDILAEMHYGDGIENYNFAWRYNALYAPVTKGVVGPTSRPDKINPDPHLYGGEVHFLQEPGLKMRAIASPYRIHQLALKPIGDSIYNVVRKLEWDCTYDQSRATPWIQKSLSAGKTVHSIDLTGATDYFPLEIQVITLRAIFGDIIDINLIEEISQLRWKSKHGDIQWKRGQPLGLYPSFGMFTLTHGLLLSFLLDREYDHQFFVVGDDVIILDDDLYHSYIALLAMMDCPWSPEKSLSSNILSEFAGKIILSDAVLPSYKWRKVSNDNFLDICKNLGPKSAVLLTKAQRRVFDSVKHLVEPIGLNISYPGSNLTKMWLETDRFLRKCEKHAMRSLVDLTRVVHRNSYESSTPYLLDPEVVQSIK
jgi:hypothetical protein